MSSLTSPSRSRTVIYVLCWLCLVADGYDLMSYGATLPSLIGRPPFDLTVAQGGHIASLALAGMLVGSLVAGTLTDILGRRRIFINSVAVFSVGMLLTAIASSIGQFLVFRTITGFGVGGLLPTAVALASEFTVGSRRSRTLGFVLTGPPTGMVLAALVSAWIVPDHGFRPVYALGAVVLLLIPVLWKLMPESPDYLDAKGRNDEAALVRQRYALPAVPVVVERATGNSGGVRELLTPAMRVPTLLIWATTFFSLLTAFGITTWLPQVMAKSGYGLGSSITFLLVYCIGAVIGTLVASRLADHIGPKRLVVAGYVIAACALVAIAFRPPTAVLVVLVLLAGYGGIGTQNILNDFIARFYPSRSRASGLGWALGIGRIGAIVGPTYGAFALASSAPLVTTGLAFAATALLGALVMATITMKTAESAPEHEVAPLDTGKVDR